ncbi:MAG: hypothetical protein JNJ49_03370 [Bdellovibrionaceae bacterium]|nr:hypothetical protein [Pseudobdellovibrionaceae bacterium]
MQAARSKDAFWNELIGQIENDLRRELEPNLHSNPPPPQKKAAARHAVPVCDYNAPHRIKLWQIKNRNRPTGLKRASTLPARTTARAVKPSPQQTRSNVQHFQSPRAIIIFELLRRHGAQFSASELSESTNGISIETKALHRERVRLIACLHPDRSGSTNTADAFQSVIEAFEELAALHAVAG